MAGDVIIIRRKKKGGDHGGHHGGAWKVAYADFVTAMMAFFLLLWLLNVTTDVERKGIADYFAPASIAKSESGAGGAMGGHTLTSQEGYVSDNSVPTVEETMIATAGQGEEGDRDVKAKNEASEGDGAGNKKTEEQKQAEQAAAAAQQAQPPHIDDATLAKAIATREAAEEGRFKEAEEMLKQAIQGSEELKDLADQLVIDHTPEGLRIQIIDKDNYSMFPSGSAIPFEKSKMLLRLVGQVVARLPNEISVSGHTDSKPFAFNSRRDNWSLSTERANVSRQELVGAGVAGTRVARVVGMADRDPFDKTEPNSSKNRRISIVLLRQRLTEDATPPAAPQTPAAPAPAAAPAEPAGPATPEDMIDETKPPEAAPAPEPAPEIAPTPAPEVKSEAPTEAPADIPVIAPATIKTTVKR